MKNIFLLLCISLIIFCSCEKQSVKQELQSDDDNFETIEHTDIYINAKEIESHYIEPVYGKVESFCFSVKGDILENVINEWIGELYKLEISYGNTKSGKNILNELLVIDAYLEGTEVVIVMNDVFEAFESNGQVSPGDFLYGLKDLLSQVTDEDSMTIYYNKKKSNVINPDGYLIDNIPLKRE